MLGYVSFGWEVSVMLTAIFRVPFTGLDLLESSLPNKASSLGPIKLSFGGAPSPLTLLSDMLKILPTSVLLVSVDASLTRHQRLNLLESVEGKDTD